ncbi:FkbM family methyltransferase [Streptomonospora nanhaiensis]|uniref:FkbM family methyltransferase n=1 Tax=Streptomonospora nanhaiensis TaxID=1323731 RepID=A0A853BUH3_9ACTN|nr:FkbM family methyltransferase [Streptomonospora nanhaiensis]MBV2365815.1 FkbM family methyltransferase [Streptomonospora nanhaiensis]MBX9391386.1 FkbM family methyltransferase [Streptomonospora nanhaiensis]NYI98151.1 FkbM family methyltransferase [Streptomonospora nanhaiensis]
MAVESTTGGRHRSPAGPPRTGARAGAGAAVDFRATPRARRRGWYGAKRPVKRLLGWGPANLAMRAAVAVAAPGLRRTGRLPVPARVAEVTGLVPGAEPAAFTMLRPSACVVAAELYWGAGRRPGAADDLALRVFAAAARRSAVLLDIGAYTGLFTLAGTAVNPRLRAHAFEIVPEVVHTLFDNCVRNRVLHRTTLHHVGVGDPATTVTMPARSGDSALPCYYSAEMVFADGVPVEVVALDSLTAAVPPGAPAVLKVDVEGTEAAVFEHGQEFLAAHRPDILCEVLPGADADRLSGLLAPHGYRFHLVGERALAPAGAPAPHDRFRDWFVTTRGGAELAAMGIPVA